MAGNANTAAALTQRVQVALTGSTVLLLLAAVVVGAIIIPAVAATHQRRNTRTAVPGHHLALTASR